MRSAARCCGTERARLLLPHLVVARPQCVPPQSAANALALVVPGVPEASDSLRIDAQRHQIRCGTSGWPAASASPSTSSG